MRKMKPASERPKRCSSVERIVAPAEGAAVVAAEFARFVKTTSVGDKWNGANLSTYPQKCYCSLRRRPIHRIEANP